MTSHSSSMVGVQTLHKTRNTHGEHNFSGLAPITDIGRPGRHFGSAPNNVRQDMARMTGLSAIAEKRYHE
jgi:hypothetical protein